MRVALAIAYATGFVLTLGVILAGSWRRGGLQRGFAWILADSAVWFLFWPTMLWEVLQRRAKLDRQS